MTLFFKSYHIFSSNYSVQSLTCPWQQGGRCFTESWFVNIFIVAVFYVLWWENCYIMPLIHFTSVGRSAAPVLTAGCNFAAVLAAEFGQHWFRLWLATYLAPRHYLNQCWVTVNWTLKPLSHSTTIPRRWHGDLKFLRAPWDRTKILENIAHNFTFSITWRCHGSPTATVAFPRSAHAPTEVWPAIDCVVTERSWRARGVQRVVTAHRRRAHSAPNAFLRRLHGVYTSISEKALQAYCRTRHAYERELSDYIA